MAEARVMDSRHVRAYSALLRFYPRRFTDRYRREMALLFAQQLEDARSTDGSLGVIQLWIRSLVDLVATASAEHFEKDVLVAQSIDGIDESQVKRNRGSTIDGPYLLAALAPAFVLLFLFVSAPHFMDPMFQRPPDFLGLPLGTVITGSCVIWYAIGVAICGVASRTSRRLVAVLVFIFPATFGFILGPAVILMLQNLTT